MIKSGSGQTLARIWHRDPDTGAQSRIQPPMTRAGKITIEPGSSQLRAHFRWWWQVQGSNLGRLSRRFYRPLPLATRATCQGTVASDGTVQDSRDSAPRHPRTGSPRGRVIHPLRHVCGRATSATSPSCQRWAGLICNLGTRARPRADAPATDNPRSRSLEQRYVREGIPWPTHHSTS